MNYVQTKTLDNHHCSEEGFPRECFALHERFSVKKSYCSYFGYANESVFSMDNILGVILLLRISTESAVV